MPNNNRNLENNGKRERKEALDNLVWYLSQRIKYPNGRKKTKFENFLNYDLGVPERRTEPLFGDDNIPNIFSSPVFTPSRPEENIKSAIDATGKVIKEIGNQTRKKTSQGEPYIPHITFATGGRVRNIHSRRCLEDGGTIYIKPSKRGTFTAAATKHGMSVQEFANKVLANKDNYSAAMVKKANFAKNASKWH